MKWAFEQDERDKKNNKIYTPKKLHTKIKARFDKLHTICILHTNSMTRVEYENLKSEKIVRLNWTIWQFIDNKRYENKNNEF